MKNVIIILTFFTFSACDFTSSADYNSKAQKLEQEEKYEKAIHFLDKALQKDPRNIYALINRAVDKSILEDYHGAIDDYSKVIQLDSANMLAFLNRGKNRKRLSDFQGAIKDFEKAIKTKGGPLFYIDKVENPMFETGFEFDVTMEEILFERGIARYNIDSLKLAFNDFNFCIKKNFERAESLYWRGIIYISSGMFRDGCRDLDEAKKLGDLDAQVMIDRYCKN